MSELATVTIWRVISRHAQSDRFWATVIMIGGDEYERVRNTKEVGRIAPGMNLRFSLRPGEYLLEVHSIRDSSAPLWYGSMPLAVQAGDRVELRCQPLGLISQLRERSSDDIKIYPGGDPSATVAVGGNEVRSALNIPEASTECTVLDMQELDLWYENLDTEQRVIENDSQYSTVTRSIRVTREWTQAFDIGEDEASTGGVKALLGPTWARVEGTVSEQIKKTYILRNSERREFSEEIAVTVAEGSRVMVTLKWKKLWRIGVAKVKVRDQIVSVRFQVAIGLTFDQAVSDI